MEPLVVPGILDSLDPVAEYVMSAAKAAGLDKRASYNLRLAVDEIVTNIILYGYQNGDIEGTVILTANIDEQALTIITEDRAKAFDPTRRDLPSEEDFLRPIEDRPVGGLGVYLAIQGVDRFSYERVEDCNRIFFVVKRPQLTATEASV